MALMNRKDFIKPASGFLTVTGVAAVIGPILAFFYPTDLEEMPAEAVPAGEAKRTACGRSQPYPFRPLPGFGGEYPRWTASVLSRMYPLCMCRKVGLRSSANCLPLS